MTLDVKRSAPIQSSRSCDVSSDSARRIAQPLWIDPPARNASAEQPCGHRNPVIPIRQSSLSFKMVCKMDCQDEQRKVQRHGGDPRLQRLLQGG